MTVKGTTPARLRLARAALAALFVSFACADARAQTPAPAAELSAALRRAFGESVEPVTRFRPYHLTGDFNHDRAEDLFVVVRLKARRDALPPGVKVVNPFGYDDAGGNASPSLAFAVIHGGPGGWRAGNAAARFLLAGGSPVLILSHERATSVDVSGTRNLMELVARADARKRRSYARMKLPASARGDWVLVGTEAAEALVYWNGTTYRYTEDPEGY